LKSAGFVLAVISAAQFMVVVDTTIVNVALPDIQSDLQFSPGGLTWVINAYVLAFAGFLLVGARSADLWGRRRVFLIGITFFTVMSLLGGLAPNGELLLAARALQGLGAAALAPATLTILMTTFLDQKARARAFGIFASVAGAGGATGVLLGGVLTDLLSWRWILLVNVPIGIALFIFALLSVSGERSKIRGTIDWGGAVTITAGLIGIVYAIVSGGSVGWSSPAAWGPLIAGAVLIAAFLIIESRHPSPLVPLRLFRSRTVSGANIIMLITQPAVFSTMFILALYLQDVREFTPLQAGLAFLPMPLGFIVGSQISSRLAHRVGIRALMIVSPLIAIVGLLWLSQINTSTPFVFIAIAAALTMIGISGAHVPVTLAANSSVEPKDAGLASGVLNTAQLLGGSVGLAISVGIAAAVTGGSDTPAALTGGYGAVFLTLAIAVAVAVVVALMIVPRRTASAAARLEEEIEVLEHSPALASAIVDLPESAAVLAQAAEQEGDARVPA
jgi:EmrB/QacA subfamily drug resistance transporter